jgi:hypothetical protein
VRTIAPEVASSARWHGSQEDENILLRLESDVHFARLAINPSLIGGFS